LTVTVALEFKEWLPLVIQSVEAYVSSEDIDKGKRWSSHIAKELETCSYGIICVTRENLNAPWVNFEAGALSKFVDESYVSPFLLDLKKSEVKGPLLQFQATAYEKEDVRKLVKSINKALEEQGLEETRLNNVFEVMWNVLEEKLNSIIKKFEHPKEDNEKPVDAKGSETINHSESILEELLELSRSQHKLLNSPEDLIPIEYFKEQVFDIYTEVTNMTRTSRELQEATRLANLINRHLKRVEENFKSFPTMKMIELNEEFQSVSSIENILKEIGEKQDVYMNELRKMLYDFTYYSGKLTQDFLKSHKNPTSRQIGNKKGGTLKVLTPDSL